MSLLSGVVLTTLIAFAPTRSQDFARALNEAKAFYAEGRFGRSIARLQRLVLELRGADTGEAAAVEAEAELLMGLAYVALDDPDSARNAFVRLVELEPERRLDPDVHAPKVIALFEEARREAARGGSSDVPPHSTTATTSIPAESDAETSPWSPLPWALLGGAAGAGTAVLAGAVAGESTTTVTISPPATTSAPAAGLEVDARVNGLKEGTFSCGQAIILSLDVVNHASSLIHVEGLDLSMNTTSPECVAHRPAFDGTVGQDVLPGARIRIRALDLGGDLCRSPGRVPGCVWRAVVVVVSGRGAFEDQITFNTIP